MLTIMIILGVLALGLIVLSGACVVLIDPIIAILIIYGIYRLIKWITSKK